MVDVETMRLCWCLRGLLLASIAAVVTGCSGGAAIPDEKLARVRTTVDDLMIRAEPLCINTALIPYRSDNPRHRCDRCQDLHDAGFLSRKIVDKERDNHVEYSLTERGKDVYRVMPDPELLDMVRKRFEQRGETMLQRDLKMLAQPRMCFGATRFHSVTDALAPIWFGGSKAFSVKIVLETKDTTGHLFDPQVAVLGLALPPPPEPGKPILHPERVWTFIESSSDGSLEVSDMRYGAWVNAE